MELQVREARLTDIERVRSLIESTDLSRSPEDLNAAADLLRQLVYLPNAAVLVAVDGRQLLGMAVLSLRPSVAHGGLVGTLDSLAVEPGNEVAGVAEALINEVVRSARNKGCTIVEATPPARSAELKRFQALGFEDAGKRLSRGLVAQRAAVPLGRDAAGNKTDRRN